MKSKKLDNMKKEYDAIPVPDELEMRVHRALKEGREEVPKKKKSWNAWTKTLTGIAAAFVILFAASNGSYTISHALEQVPVLGSFVQVITVREFESKDDKMEANVKVPEVQADSAKLNANIKDYTDKIISRYQADVKAGGGKTYKSVDVDYKTVTNNDKIFALRFDETVAMADTNDTVKIYDVDKKTGNILSLHELFKDNSDWNKVLSTEIIRQMKAQMAEDAENGGEKGISYWVNSDTPEWDFKRLESDQSFYINKDGKLVIVFNKGEAGPMSMGCPEFVIPTSVTDTISNGRYL